MEDETVRYHFKANLHGEDRREEVVKVIQNLKTIESLNWIIQNLKTIESLNWIVSLFDYIFMLIEQLN
jgi:hypothetical protein